jgi:hypothetical protein
MAFTEQRVLNQVTVLPEQSAINAQWLDQVLKDGVVIASTPFRKAYTVDQKDELLAELDKAEYYVSILDW